MSSSCSCVGINPSAREGARIQLGAERLGAMLGWGTDDLGQPHPLRNHTIIKHSESCVAPGPAEVICTQPLLTDYA